VVALRASSEICFVIEANQIFSRDDRLDRKINLLTDLAANGSGITSQHLDLDTKRYELLDSRTGGLLGRVEETMSPAKIMSHSSETP